MIVLATIERLRAIVASATRGEILPGDCEWLSASLGDYLTKAETGLSLEQAFGLDVQSGAEPWWIVEARAGRRAALCEFYEQHCLAASESARLAVLQAELRRYARRRDRTADRSPDIQHLPRGLLFRAFRCHDSISTKPMPTSAKQLRRILATHSDGEGKSGHRRGLSVSQTKVHSDETAFRKIVK